MSDDNTPRLHRIRIWPEEPLHTVAEPVTVFAKGLRRLIRDMFATMIANQGVGLAAPQIGISQRIIVIRIEDGKPLTFVNPEVIESSDDMFKFEEGCLSVPGYFEARERPNKITVSFQDEQGNKHEEQFEGIYAFAIQHEIDHLDGKVFVDDVSFFKKGRVKKKIKKALPEQAARAHVASATLDQWWSNIQKIDNKDGNTND